MEGLRPATRAVDLSAQVHVHEHTQQCPASAAKTSPTAEHTPGGPGTAAKDRKGLAEQGPYPRCSSSSREAAGNPKSRCFKQCKHASLERTRFPVLSRQPGSITQSWWGSHPQSQLCVGFDELQRLPPRARAGSNGNRGAQIIQSKHPAKPSPASFFPLSITYGWTSVNKLPVEMGPAEHALR